MPTYNYVLDWDIWQCVPMVSVVLIYKIFWIKSRSLRVIYTVFYCTLWTNCVHCPLSLLQNIYTSTKLKYCPLSALDIISFGDWVVTVNCFQRGWALWVLLWVGVVFRELPYCLGRWAGGSAGARLPTCECYMLIVSGGV